MARTNPRAPKSALGIIDSVRQAVSVALDERGLRPQSGRILVALSGGPDSRVLLDALVALTPAQSLGLTVCVVDHGLRRGSAREARGALEVAKHLGVPGTVARVVVEEKSARGAREARYGALARAAIDCGAEAIALGHTASDQAETLLDHLLRGAGSRGLGAMEPKRPMHTGGADHLWLIRPLLEVSRAQVEAYVDAAGLAVVRDPTNVDLRYRRSRIRSRVMPLLREERPDLDLALVRLCERLRQDADYIEKTAMEAAARITTADGYLDLDGLSQLHVALQARVLRSLSEAVGVPGDRVPLDALLRLARGRHGTSHIDLPAGVRAERRYGRLRVFATASGASEEGPEEQRVDRAGLYALGPITVSVPEKLMAQGPLVLRRPRSGDRLAGKKLSQILIDQKVARPDRARLWTLAEVDDPGAVKWAILCNPPGELAWEWPCSGIRPRLVR